ncbi:MAG: SPOR domain-containing protein, partial [Armatimonadetes bacterium]|nr:SPOR domain-containing protein [Armatimonadota bacterium]
MIKPSSVAALLLLCLGACRQTPPPETPAAAPTPPKPPAAPAAKPVTASLEKTLTVKPGETV